MLHVRGADTTAEVTAANSMQHGSETMCCDSTCGCDLGKISQNLRVSERTKKACELMRHFF